MDAATDPPADANDVSNEDATDDVIGDADADTTTDPAGPSDAALRAYCGDDFAAVEERIDAALAAMTLSEKAALMHGNFVVPRDGTWDTDGVEALGIPGFQMLDGPRGLSSFSRQNGTAFPVAMARGATWDPELEYRVGQTVGGELRIAGANVLLAPTVNILRHPRWGRAQETYGEDPYHMAEMGTGFVLGAQEHVIAVVKHYAVNSIENTRLEVDVSLDERTLREIYLPHFRAIVRDGQVGGVMSSYNRINGDWGSESDHLLSDILRAEWDFAGFVVSDFLWGTHNTVPALEAGLDLEMQISMIYGLPVVRAVEAGEVDGALVDAAVRRMLRAQWCFEARTSDPSFDTLESDESLALAREVAVRSMVLLENRDDALPIDRSSAPTIAVIGSLADTSNTGDDGSSAVDSTHVVTMLEGLVANARGDVGVVANVVSVVGDISAGADRDIVADADFVIAIVGYDDTEEGEGQIAAGDRVSLALPDDDLALLGEATTLNDHVVAVIVSGSAFVTDGWGDDVEAIVASWYAGAEGGNALAALLYGAENFSGRLPITFAARDEDYPPFDNESLQVTYDYFHGYRHLQNEAVAPLYAFGYGLSYTTFELSNIAVASNDTGSNDPFVTVSVDVENTGATTGTLTVQVYVRGPDDDVVARSPRDLRGFAQVELAPGANERVEVAVPLASLEVYDEQLSAWVLRPGTYTFEVATDVESVVESVELTLPQ